MSPYAEQLRSIASECERRSAALMDLAFCFDVYLDHTENNAKPTHYADGSVAMNAEKATEQLKEAICRAIGLKPMKNRGFGNAS
jgi:hypothetical protein